MHFKMFKWHGLVPGGLVAWSNREESSHQGWQRGGGVGQAQHRTGAMAMAADGAGMGCDWKTWIK